MKGFILMLTFMTRFPVNYSFEFNREDFVKGIKYMPIIGLIIGACLYPITFMSGKVAPSVMAILVLMAYLMITGGLHLDGLADVSDGLFSCRDKERMFEIMKDSRIGAFGVIALIFYFISMLVLLGLSEATTILIFPLVGRAVAMMVCSVSKYARLAGLGKDVVDETTYRHGIGAMIFVVLMIMGLKQYILLGGFIITSIIIGCIVRSIHNKLDGITGDVVGMTIECSQVIFLLSTYLLNQLIMV